MRETIDATAREATLAAVARDEQEMLSADETVAALAAPTPLAEPNHRRPKKKIAP